MYEIRDKKTGKIVDVMLSEDGYVLKFNNAGRPIYDPTKHKIDKYQYQPFTPKPNESPNERRMRVINKKAEDNFLRIASCIGGIPAKELKSKKWEN